MAFNKAVVWPAARARDTSVSPMIGDNLITLLRKMATTRAQTPEIPGVEACGIDAGQTRADSNSAPPAKRVKTSEVGMSTRKHSHGKGWTPQHHYGNRSDGQSSCSFGRCIFPGVGAPLCPCCRAKAPPGERGMHSCKVCRPPSPCIELS